LEGFKILDTDFDKKREETIPRGGILFKRGY